MSVYIVIFLSIIFSAFFSGMEIAFISSNKLRLEIDKKQEAFGSRILALFANHPSNYIATMLIGNNVALVIYGIAMGKLLEPIFLQYVTSPSSILFLKTVISTLIILVTAEFLPKTIFRLNANSLLNFFSLPVFILYILLYPITIFTTWISGVLMRFARSSNSDSDNVDSLFGKTDLNNLVNEVSEDDSVANDSEQEIKYFQNALDFSNVKVRDCMVPRTEIEAQDSTVEIEYLKTRFIETGYSKILIYNNDVDNIIGYVHSKDLFKSPESVGNILRQIAIIPETMPANKLLRKFIQDKKKHFNSCR
jgi:CBS domain containing-hemolysin-like protein